jgi:hypothetical protein
MFFTCKPNMSTTESQLEHSFIRQLPGLVCADARFRRKDFLNFENSVPVRTGTAMSPKG